VGLREWREQEESERNSLLLEQVNLKWKERKERNRGREIAMGRLEWGREESKAMTDYDVCSLC